MQQEPDVIETIDDEDIAALADMINESFADDEEVQAEETAEDFSEVLASEGSEEPAEKEVQPLDSSEYLRLIEALLFASPEPLTVNAIRERMPEDADVGGLLMELQALYEGRGVNLLNMDGHWALRTAADLSDALSMKKDVQRKLSKAAMETLAIVSYHQPVTRPEIENIRGVAISNGTLDVLMECGWVKPGRRRDTPGRPLTWVTTPAFLDHFGLTTLNDLPGMDELKASGLLDSRPAIAVTTGNLFGPEDEMLASDLQESDLSDDEDYDDEDADDDIIVAEDESEVSEESVEEIAVEGESEEEASDDDDFDDEDEDDAEENSVEEDSDDNEDDDEGEPWDDMEASNDDDDADSDEDDEEEVA
ncbi:MAG: SMC-Scp complex subunit ScpB [Micavibrio sp.]